MTARSADVTSALAWLERRGSKRVRDDMLKRYGIVAPKAFGVSVGMIQQLAKQIGRNHELALALWETGWYEARLLTAYLDDPAQVTSAQMDRWAKQFDNWGVCDTLCFALFDRTPHAWKKMAAWSRRREEYVKRAAFALLAGLGLHDKESGDDRFIAALDLVERAAPDPRPMVRKGISWGFRVIGRRSSAINEAAVSLSRRLADSAEPSARALGREALKELTSPMVRRQLAAKRSRAR